MTLCAARVLAWSDLDPQGAAPSGSGHFAGGLAVASSSLRLLWYCRIFAALASAT
jgi:hypothetical protein